MIAETRLDDIRTELLALIMTAVDGLVAEDRASATRSKARARWS